MSTSRGRIQFNIVIATCFFFNFMIKLSCTSTSNIASNNKLKLSGITPQKYKIIKNRLSDKNITLDEIKSISEKLGSGDINGPVQISSEKYCKDIHKDLVHSLANKIKKPSLSQEDYHKKLEKYFDGYKSDYLPLFNVRNFLRNINGEIEPKYLDNIITAWSLNHVITKNAPMWCSLVFVDFEFFSYINNTTLVFTGALGTFHDPEITMLSGPVWEFDFTSGSISVFHEQNAKRFENNANRILKKNPNLLNTMIKCFRDALKRPNRYLNSNFVNNYIQLQSPNPIMVAYNYNTDKNIFDLLTQKKTVKWLNILGYNCYNNKEFYLLLKASHRMSYLQIPLGTREKNGRILSLGEVHSSCCKQNHQNVEAHDGKTDVLFLQCIMKYARDYNSLQLEMYLSDVELITQEKDWDIKMF
ncbi:uncharacterized protein LOC126894509 [Daktulosphaira vitifoliae]|uniref:uncharacterized protein LOC126894509 n=1 Tax=Daktulosphaira vitifoliae TaxID=58002 RepID=UPI0021AAF1B9|nr:uncharacterized protein LOC126894509 [Daktulosphaira vitifoliae]